MVLHYNKSGIAFTSKSRPHPTIFLDDFNASRGQKLQKVVSAQAEPKVDSKPYAIFAQLQTVNVCRPNLQRERKITAAGRLVNRVNVSHLQLGLRNQGPKEGTPEGPIIKSIKQGA